MFLFKTKFYPGKIIKYNPSPDKILKIKIKTTNNKKKTPSSTFNTVNHLRVNEISEAVGESAVVKGSRLSPAGARTEADKRRSVQRVATGEKRNKMPYSEDMLRSINYIDPRVPSQKG